MKRMAMVVVLGLVASLAMAGQSGPSYQIGDEVGAAAAGNAAVVRAQQFVDGPGARAIGVRQDERLTVRSVNDDGAGVAHVRFDSRIQGVRVWGGEVIVHVDQAADSVRGVTNQHRHARLGDLHPMVSEAEAAGIAWSALAPAAAPQVEPATELVIYTKDGVDHLVWMVDAFFENGVEDPEARMFVIDARSGEIIDSWDNLQTGKPTGGTATPGTGTASTGTAKTLYLGQLSLPTEYYSSAAKYGMVDRLRGNAYTINMANSTKSGTLLTDADNVWGNSLKTDPATAGTDAHLGMAYTWDYFKNVHGRNGIYNDGKGVYSRVHYGRSYNNAFWSASCKCMTYGDGDGVNLSPLVSIDVAAHEMSHGVNAATANLVYSGESGGLNESNSDIFAAAVEFYINNAKDTPDWMIGEVIYTPSRTGDALRYMNDPTKDGYSIDHYSDFYSTLDVHYSSGLANNWFYLLSAGGTNKTSGTKVTGIGITKAERIWYVALTGYMTSTTNFKGARTATLNAATQLFGANSTEYNAVAAAWTACGVN